MILQELLFPSTETCSTMEMYFRLRPGEHAPWRDPEADALRVPRWSHLDLNTYFNSFSIAKWAKYTRLDNLCLELDLTGAFQVQLVHWEMIGKKTFQHVFAEHVCRADERQTFKLAIPMQMAARGVVCCSLYALGEECALHGGAYVTEIDPDGLNEVNIAIDICTFKREPFIERNLALLNREIIDNPDNDLHGHLDVFIADNGQTLDIPRLSSDRVHIFPNKNAGGSGGFARGMMEIIDCAPARTFSHVLVMDDDVLIHTDALTRTYRLLRLLKPEYAGKTIAGAMLRLNNRWKQHECCGNWNGRYVNQGKKSLDLRQMENVLRNEVEAPFDFNAWWYSCIPMSKVTNDNLPMPMFIRMDDIEFGLRTGSDILSMNGICLWHEPFAYRFTSSNEYYEIRNLMMMNAIHRPGLGWRTVAMQVLYRTLANLVRYRYKDCELLFRGVRDYLAGAEALARRDPATLHQEIMAASDKFLPLGELDVPFDEKAYRKNLKKNTRFIQKARLVFLNGLFLPPKGPTTVDAFLAPPWACYRRKALLNYSEVTQRGFVTRRSVLKSLGYCFKALGMCFRLMTGYRTAGETYRQAHKVLTSRAFWDEYLDLNEEKGTR